VKLCSSNCYAFATILANLYVGLWTPNTAAWHS
jgi:hypothetical protein